MNQISKVVLKNFKCFENQTLKFSPLTVFTGINGLGKSTAIQSLLLLRQSNDVGSLMNTGLTLNGDLVNIGTGKDSLYQGSQIEEIEFCITGTKDNLEYSWVWSYEKDLDLLPISRSANKEMMYSLDLFASQLIYLCAERIGPQSAYKTAQYKVRQLKQLGTRGEFSIQYLSIYGEMPVMNQNLLQPESKSNNLKAQVDAWMSLISPGTRLAVIDHPDMDLVSLRYEFVGKKEVSNAFRPQNVGFGLTNILPVIIALLSAEPGSTLIIENPEAHLHPKGQARLGQLIALASAGGVQIIIETHSDHIINGIRIAVYNKKIKANDVSIHFFERDFSQDYLKTSVVTPKLDNQGRFDNWPVDFFDEWEKSLDALLEPLGEEEH